MGEISTENKYDSIYGLNVPEWARKENGQVELWLAFYGDTTYEEAQTIANKYSTSTPVFEAYPYEVDCIIVTNETSITLIAREDLVRRVSFSGYEPVPEDNSPTDSKDSPGFQLIFSLLSLSITILFLRRRNLNDK